MATKKGKGNKSSATKTSRTIDFTGVTTFKICEPGIHLAKVVEYEFKKSQNNNPVVKISLEVIKGSEGATLNETFNTNGKGLFKLKGFLLALGIKVPDGKMKVDFSKLIGKQVTLHTDEEEYTNSEDEEKTRSSIEDFFPKADYSIRKKNHASDAVDDKNEDDSEDFDDEDDDFEDDDDDDDFEDDEDDEDEEDEDDDDFDDDEDEEDEDDDFDDEDEDEDDDDDDGYTEAQLKKMKESELRKICKELKIKIVQTDRGNMSISKTRNKILKKQG